MSKTLFWYVFRDLLPHLLHGLRRAGRHHELRRPAAPAHRARPRRRPGQQDAHLFHAGDDDLFVPGRAPCSPTTMVYGRLSADNELTACRAGGISFLSMTTPAMVLGLLVALISLLFLCFVVPDLHAQGRAGRLLQSRPARPEPDRAHAPDRAGTSSTSTPRGAASSRRIPGSPPPSASSSSPP